MSLASFWARRLPIVHDEMNIFDTYHVYITKHDYVHQGRDYEVVTDYGSLKLCLNINMRRSPISPHAVREVHYREPYAHCEKCMRDLDYLQHAFAMSDVKVIVLR